MNKPDYIYKSYILDNCKDVLLLEKNLRRHMYLKEDFEISPGVVIDPDQCSVIYENLSKSDREFKEAMRLNHARQQRSKRLASRIGDMLDNYAHVLFCTFTFTDEVLNKTDKQTRRAYIRRFLKKYAICYIANIDFGKKTDREHYHAVAVSCPILGSLYKYGFCNVQSVCHDESDSQRLSKYISKLSNHAIKHTTKRNSLIYSRNS